MFGRLAKQVKAEIEGIKAYVLALEERVETQAKLIKAQDKKIKELLDPKFYEWKTMSIANEKSAAKQGHWYLNSKTDTQLLEQIISEINKNEDLCALLTTSDGTTLSLRVHSQPKETNRTYMNFSGEEE